MLTRHFTYKDISLASQYRLQHCIHPDLDNGAVGVPLYPLALFTTFMIMLCLCSLNSNKGLFRALKVSYQISDVLHIELIQFSAWTLYILRAEGRMLNRDGVLVSFLTLTPKCVNKRGNFHLKELCLHLDITYLFCDCECHIRPLQSAFIPLCVLLLLVPLSKISNQLDSRFSLLLIKKGVLIGKRELNQIIRAPIICLN